MKHFLRLAALLACLIAPSAADAAARFLVACTTSCTWDNSSTAIWSTTSGGAPGSSAPVAGDAVTLDANSCVGGVTCTITVNANLAMTSLTMGACTASTTGCILDFSANNNNATLSGLFSISGSGTRTLNMGSGTFTLTAATGVVFDATTTTNLTLSAGTSTLLLSATATNTRTLSMGNKTFPNITVTNAAPSQFMIDFAAAGLTWSAANLTFTNVQQVRLGATGTITLSGSLTYNNSASNIAGTIFTNGGIAVTISSAGASTLNFVSVQSITKAGAGSITATNSFDAGGNTGVTITGPSGGAGGRIIGG